MATNQTLAVKPYDGVFDMWNFDYSVVNVFVHNAHSGTVSITEEEMIMLPCVYNAGVAKLTPAASAATYNAVILEADGDVTSLSAAASSTTIKVRLLIRGPAMLKDANINLVDAEDAAITLATVKTALLACSPPIVTQTETTNTLTGPV